MVMVMLLEMVVMMVLPRVTEHRGSSVDIESMHEYKVSSTNIIFNHNILIFPSSFFFSVHNTIIISISPGTPPSSS